jgi:hypothetical protein
MPFFASLTHSLLAYTSLYLFWTTMSEKCVVVKREILQDLHFDEQNFCRLRLDSLNREFFSFPFILECDENHLQINVRSEMRARENVYYHYYFSDS